MNASNFIPQCSARPLPILKPQAACPCWCIELDFRPQETNLELVDTILCFFLPLLFFAYPNYPKYQLHKWVFDDFSFQLASISAFAWLVFPVACLNLKFIVLFNRHSWSYLGKCQIKMPAHIKVYFYLSKVNFRKSSPRFGFAPCHRNFSALYCSMFNWVEKSKQKNSNNNNNKKGANEKNNPEFRVSENYSFLSFSNRRNFLFLVD